MSDTLPFSKISDFIPHDEDKVEDMEKDGLTSLHSRNIIDIRLCLCRRCLRHKFRKAVSQKKQELNRELTNDERNLLNMEIYQQTQEAIQNL